MAGTLEFRRSGTLHIAHGHGEGNQRRRHIKLLERAGHGILTADRAGTKINLSHQRAKHGGHRLAPTGRLIAKLLEILLEAQVRLLMLEAGSNQLRQRFNHRQVSAGELVLLHNERVEAPSHRGRGSGFAEHRKLGNHGHIRGQLLLAAERHEYGTCTDSGIETLGKTLIGSHVQIGEHGMHTVRQGTGNPRSGVGLLRFDVGHLMLRGTVGSEEFTRQINDRVAVPHHSHARIFGYGRDDFSLEILFLGVAEELVDVFGCNVHGHTFLRFGNRKFRAVQALVLFRNLVEIDIQAVSELTNSNGNAASTEIVATLDQTACVTATEQTLQLTLDRSVALLHFGTVKLQRLNIVSLGRAGGTTNAVTSGTAAEQNDLVARSGGFAAHMICRSRGHNRTDLHTLGHIARVIDLVDLTGGKTNLVAV